MQVKLTEKQIYLQQWTKGWYVTKEIKHTVYFVLY